MDNSKAERGEVTGTALGGSAASQGSKIGFGAQVATGRKDAARMQVGTASTALLCCRDLASFQSPVSMNQARACRQREHTHTHTASSIAHEKAHVINRQPASFAKKGLGGHFSGANPHEQECSLQRGPARTLEVRTEHWPLRGPPLEKARKGFLQLNLRCRDPLLLETE